MEKRHRVDARCLMQSMVRAASITADAKVPEENATDARMFASLVSTVIVV